MSTKTSEAALADLGAKEDRTVEIMNWMAMQDERGRLNDETPPMTTEMALYGLENDDELLREELEQLPLLSNKLLAAIVRGELDVRPVAAKVLAQRGYNADEQPKWVGFEAAHRELLGA